MPKLSSMFVQKVSKKGRYADDNGLYLQVSKTNVKSWLFRYSKNGKGISMGLGSLNAISLSEARELAHQHRKTLALGKAPLEERSIERRNQALAKTKQITFSDCASQFIESRKANWKNIKHYEQWITTIEKYANPVIGDLHIQNVDTTHIHQILDPIWNTKNETASRLRNRIEQILSYAKARGYRAGENPATWRGHLDASLPKPSMVQKRKHHKALSYEEINSFMDKLINVNTLSAKCIEFLILTATRTSESLGAKWSEINFDKKMWTIPASRMKGKRDHRVALSDKALSLLIRIKEQFPTSGFIFQSPYAERPLCSNALLKLIKVDMQLNITVHGFRSTFSDWAAETTDFSRDLVEMALAHKIQNATEAAYRRGDMFERRISIMNEWARHCYNDRSTQADILHFYAKDRFV